MVVGHSIALVHGMYSFMIKMDLYLGLQNKSYPIINGLATFISNALKLQLGMVMNVMEKT